MSSSTEWLAQRRPAPPPELAGALAVADAPGALHEGLAAEAAARLGQARARPGRVRESAFRLLEADALLTYASEAALEADDPEDALRRVLAAAGS